MLGIFFKHKLVVAYLYIIFSISKHLMLWNAPHFVSEIVIFPAIIRIFYKINTFSLGTNNWFIENEEKKRETKMPSKNQRVYEMFWSIFSICQNPSNLLLEVQNLLQWHISRQKVIVWFLFKLLNVAFCNRETEKRIANQMYALLSNLWCAIQKAMA